MKRLLNRLYRTLFCTGGYGVHSPFVFGLITDVIEERRSYYCYESLHAVRLQLSQGRQRVADCGGDAGTVGRYLHKYGFTRQEDEFLFRLANRFKPAATIVVGSGLGLTPLYLTACSKEAHCIVLEPESSVATIASALAERYAATQMTIYELSLRTVFDEIARVSMLPKKSDYADGNASRDTNDRPAPWHTDLMVWGRSFTSEAGNDLMDAFERSLPLMHEESIFVMPDIHAFRGNRACWRAVCAHPRVTVALDLYSQGVVFFNPKLPRKTYKSIV
jgi:hypothetical protein